MHYGNIPTTMIIILLRSAYVLTAFVAVMLSINVANAAPITFRYDHHLFTLNPDSYGRFEAGVKQWQHNGTPVQPQAMWRTDGDVVAPLPKGVALVEVSGFSQELLESVLYSQIASSLNREAGSVVIKGSADEGITFEGVGLTGREVQIPALAELVKEAVKQNITDITIPVTVVQPTITVESEELRERGIKEVVTVGESNFYGSTWDRQHNIRTGLEKFNGTLIPQGSIFSFNTVLGPVNGATGYRRELVIKGDRTEPDYGGGLCQVSTTAYRGIWEYGFPIESRRNHSYTVSYYSPQGTDATIYPGVQDMQFTNNSPGDLLIQTHMEGVKAYFIYYGTTDNRSSEIVGPYTWARTGIPAQRIEYTTDLPPGAQRKLGSPVSGMKTMWYRVLDNGEVLEDYFSSYQARPLFLQIGADNKPSLPVDQPNPTDPNAVPVPSWLAE